MTMLLLLLPVLMAGHALAASEVKVPEQQVALVGTDAVLNCSFGQGAPFNLSELSVFWQLTDTKRSVHSYYGSRDQLAEQGLSFANRTSLFPARLALGDASLLLRRVGVADEGSYTCFVRVESYGSAALFLQVAAPYSKPQVTLVTESNLRPGDQVELTCAAHGGYPEPAVLWQDGGGRNLTGNVTTSVVANEEGLFSVRSVLAVTLEPNSTYSCRLSNPLLGDEGHASVTITGQSLAFPPVAMWVTVCLAVCLLALLVALAAVCRRKILESCEEARAAEEAKELEETESKTALTTVKS